MEEFKEFQGKDLDTCIESACSFFDCPREKLEVEIIQDAKSGIFGIVGARKAKIRARYAHLSEKMLDFLDSGTYVQQQTAIHSRKRPAKAHNEKPLQKTLRQAEGNQQTVGEKANQKIAEKQERKAFRTQARAESDIQAEDMRPGIDKLDSENLASLACETIATLIRPIAGMDVDVHAEVAHGRVKVNVDWEGDAGLLIGRDGQTLASLQYVASRILSHKMDAGVRIQLEIGDYKSRQDDRLRERAHILAEKARQTGHSWSTQPLSSYHRRIIHMELQEEPGIITRSVGDGIMKKVVITPKRPCETA